MAGFPAAFINELIKLRKRKKLTAAIILSILAVIIGQGAITAIQLGLGLRVAGSTEFPLVVLSLFSHTVLPLFVTFIAIDMFNGEYANKTIKLTLTRPVSRFGVYSAKVLNLATFILANLMLIMLLSFFAGLLFNPVSTSLSTVMKVILAYMVTFLPLFVFSLIVVVLANLLHRGLTVFFVAILIYLCFHFLVLLLPRLSSLLVTSMFDWYSLWISHPLSGFKLLRLTMIQLGCGLMLFAAGYYLFDRKEF